MTRRRGKKNGLYLTVRKKKNKGQNLTAWRNRIAKKSLTHHAVVPVDRLGDGKEADPENNDSEFIPCDPEIMKMKKLSSELHAPSSTQMVQIKEEPVDINEFEIKQEPLPMIDSMENTNTAASNRSMADDQLLFFAGGDCFNQVTQDELKKEQDSPSRHAAQEATKEIYNTVHQFNSLNENPAPRMPAALNIQWVTKILPSHIREQHTPRGNMMCQEEQHMIRSPHPDLNLSMECNEELLSATQAKALLKAQLKYNIVMKNLRILKADDANIVCTSDDGAELEKALTPPIIPVPAIAVKTSPTSEPNIIPATSVQTTVNSNDAVPVQLSVVSSPLSPTVAEPDEQLTSKISVASDMGTSQFYGKANQLNRFIPLPDGTQSDYGCSSESEVDGDVSSWSVSESEVDDVDPSCSASEGEVDDVDPSCSVSDGEVDDVDPSCLVSEGEVDGDDVDPSCSVNEGEVDDVDPSCSVSESEVDDDDPSWSVSDTYSNSSDSADIVPPASPPNKRKRFNSPSTTVPTSSASPSTGAQSSVPSTINPPVWERKDIGLEGQNTEFNGTKNVFIPPDKKEPVDIFLHLLTDDLVSHTVSESMKYASQCGDTKFSLADSDLKSFIGANIFMGLTNYPEYSLYWSYAFGTRLPSIADYMTLKQFETVKRNMHFNDNAVQPKPGELGFDKLYKIRPVIDKLKISFLAACDIEESINIVEMLIPFKGRHNLKQYIGKKPKKWGFKVWVAAGISGYISSWNIYEGKNNWRSKEFGVGNSVVLNFCKELKHKNHKVYFDNNFASHKLIAELSKLSVLAVCNARVNRCGKPPLKADKYLKKRGNYDYLMDVENNVGIVKWRDNNIVTVLSNFAGVEPKDETKRWCKKGKKHIIIKQPHAIQIYNKHMGGVDKMDKQVSLFRIFHKNKKWYMRIWWHLIDITLNNAWLLHCQTLALNEPSKKASTLWEFRTSVARSLLMAGSKNTTIDGQSTMQVQIRNRKPRIAVPAAVRFDKLDHWPLKTKKPHSDRCKFCSEQNIRSTSRYYCSKCNVALCIECFLGWHKR